MKYARRDEKLVSERIKTFIKMKSTNPTQHQAKVENSNSFINKQSTGTVVSVG